MQPCFSFLFRGGARVSGLAGCPERGADGLGGPSVPQPSRRAQAHPCAAAIRIDEFYTSGFEGCAQGGNRLLGYDAPRSFKINYSRETDPGLIGQFRL